jgi:hypothetical protein
MPSSGAFDAFVGALLDPTRGAPAQTIGREGAPDARRFAVYRNNVAVSLIGAIEARYPVTRRLVGEEFFRAMARSFVARSKPRSPVVLHYGAEFPDFVATFDPARDLVFLPDVARLENAWVEAYHSADEDPLELAALAAAAPDTLGQLRLKFHPAARLLCSDYPAASIWAGHQGAGEFAPPEHWIGEQTLITRPGADVKLRLLPVGGYSFARALQHGATLGEAHAATRVEGFDPGLHLVGLIEAGAISRLGI